MSIGIPIFEYRDQDRLPISEIENKQRIGQIIFELNKEKYFGQIYKPSNFYHQEFGLIPRISSAYYPVENDGKGNVQKVFDTEFFNSGFGKVIDEDERGFDKNEQGAINFYNNELK